MPCPGQGSEQQMPVWSHLPEYVGVSSGLLLSGVERASGAQGFPDGPGASAWRTGEMTKRVQTEGKRSKRLVKRFPGGSPSLSCSLAPSPTLSCLPEPGEKGQGKMGCPWQK